MADLSSLGHVSISEMSRSDALLLIKQIRFSRRVPAKTTKKPTKKKAKAPVKNRSIKPSKSQAQRLLKELEGLV